MTLVDSSVILDVLGADPDWCEWSCTALAECGLRGPLYINDVILAEVAMGFASADALPPVLEALSLTHLPLSPAALHLAGRAFSAYRAQGGGSTGVLPEFFIGAQAHVEHLTLLTRIEGRFAHAFPELRRITPDHSL